MKGRAEVFGRTVGAASAADVRDRSPAFIMCREEEGSDPFDALHLACAKKAGAIFLTTDDVLIKMIIKKARRQDHYERA